MQGGDRAAQGAFDTAGTSHIILSSDEEGCALKPPRAHRSRHGVSFPKKKPSDEIVISSDSEEAGEIEIEAITEGLSSIKISSDKEVQTDISIAPCHVASALDIAKLTAKETPSKETKEAPSKEMAASSLCVGTSDVEGKNAPIVVEEPVAADCCHPIYNTRSKKNRRSKLILH